MFESSEATSLRKHFKKYEEPSQLYEGANRRTIGLLPDPVGTQGAVISIGTVATRQRLLVALEADQQSCCLKIASEKRKSRAAILVFRGRVLGTVYGRKLLENQEFDHNAYSNACVDLVDPESSVDAYTLADELVIAAAALFHGQPFDIEREETVQETFKQYLQVLIESNMPGCLVVSNANHIAVCIVYVFAGKLVGLYAAREGWLPPSLSVAFNQVAKHHNATITGSMLRARNVDEVFDLTFSLSGLADRSTQGWSDGHHPKIDQSVRIAKVDVGKIKGLTKPVTQDRFIPNKGRGMSNPVNRNSSFSAFNPFSADP